MKNGRRVHIGTVYWKYSTIDDNNKRTIENDMQQHSLYIHYLGRTSIRDLSGGLLDT